MEPKPANTRSDPVTGHLIDRLHATFPSWRVCAHDVQYPPQGQCATVAFLRDHVIKMIPQLSPSNSAGSLATEIWVLRTLTRALTAAQQSSADFFGTNVPLLVEPNAFHQDLSLYVMDRLPGRPRDQSNVRAGHPDVVDQIATFFVRFNDVINDEWNRIKDTPHDDLEQFIVWNARDFQRKQDQAAKDGFLWGLDRDLLARGEKALQIIAPDFTPYIERAKMLMQKLSAQQALPHAFMHGDLHLHNMLLDVDRDPQTSAVRSIQSGIIDFGIIHWGDPRLGLAKFFICSQKHDQTTAILQSIDAKRAALGRPSWGDPTLCAQLAPLHLAVATAHDDQHSPLQLAIKNRRRRSAIQYLTSYLDSIDRTALSGSSVHPAVPSARL